LDKLFAGKSWVALCLLAVGPVAVLGMQLWRRVRSPLAIPAWCWFGAVWLAFALGSLVAYSAFGVTLWSWYVVPIGMALMMAAAGGVAGLTAGERTAPRDATWAAVGLLAAVVVDATPPLPDLARAYFAGKNVS